MDANTRNSWSEAYYNDDERELQRQQEQQQQQEQEQSQPQPQRYDDHHMDMHYPNNPYMDDAAVAVAAHHRHPHHNNNNNNNNIITEDIADRSFNTSAIHGNEDDIYGSNNNNHRRRNGASWLDWWRHRPFTSVAVAVLVIVLIVGSSVGIANSTKNKASRNSYSDYSGDDDDEPAVGTTRYGPKEPVVDLPPDQVLANKNEFGVVLVNTYKQLGLPWNQQISDETSAIGKALLFVTGTPEQYNSFSSDEQKVQRFALAAFYYSTFMQPHAFWTDPTDWTSAERWMSAADECTWEGIYCNDSRKVIGIVLSNHALSGYLPLELAMLDRLEQLALGNNYIHMSSQTAGSTMDDQTPGGLQVFGLLSNLQRLELDDNYILTENGLPSEFGKLTALQRISMSYNLLQGPLTESVIQNWSQLTHLEMESNYLTGSVPTALGQIENLYYIYLRRNLLTIDLADMLSSTTTTTTTTPALPYSNLFSLWLDDNLVKGSMPTQMGTLTGLASLSITNTTLEGTLPTELGNCLLLQRVWLYSNQLTGTIPSQLAALTKLEVLEVYDNLLQGDMPPGVCSIVDAATYEYKTLSADCDAVGCDNCCTDCYEN